MGSHCSFTSRMEPLWIVVWLRRTLNSNKSIRQGAAERWSIAVDPSCSAEADGLAKLAAEEDQVLLTVRKQLLTHAKKGTDVAKCVGRATLAINQFEACIARYGAVTKADPGDAAAE